MFFGKKKKIEDLELAFVGLAKKVEELDSDGKVMARYIINLEKEIADVLKKHAASINEISEHLKNRADVFSGTVESMNVIHGNMVSIIKALNNKGIITEEDLTED